MREISNSPLDFVVVFRAPSAPCFAKGTSLSLRIVYDGEKIQATFRTRHIDVGLAKPLPGHLWIDARGHANGIEDAVSKFGAAVDSIVPLIAFCCNAAVAGMEPELAFNNTPNLSKREFFQQFVPQERPLIHSGRKVEVPIVEAFIGALEGHPEKDRIGRALSHYRLALQHWRWGHEVMATAHLYIGMETLTKCVLRTRYDGLSEDETALRLGIDPAKLGPFQRLRTEIEAAARREVLFQGDENCYRRAKAASDGLEHGFMGFNEVHENARAVRDKTARYLREAILGFLRIDEQTNRRLLEAPYDKPLGHWPVVKYLRGELLGDSDQLAAPGNEYPIMTWKSKIEDVEVSEKGEYKINFNESFTPHLAEGVKFQPKSFEAWRP